MPVKKKKMFLEEICSTHQKICCEVKIKVALKKTNPKQKQLQ